MAESVTPRGSIVYGTFVGGLEHGQGTRPLLVISRTEVTAALGWAIALPITSTPAGNTYPILWRVPDGLLPKPSWVQIVQPRAVPVARLRERIATLEPDAMDEIIAGLRQMVE